MPAGSWRERRRQRWDRPPPPRDWRWVVGHVGRVLVAVGLLMFGFVGYQLWGTGLQYAQAQDRLDDEFAELLAATTTSTSTSTPAPPSTSASAPPSTTPTSSPPSATPPAGGSGGGPTTAPPTSTSTTTAPAPTAPPITEGDVIARIEAPAMGLDAKIVAGVSTADLRRGPGHYPATPLPGQLGNAAIAGHRTTYGQPFHRIDDLVPGDEIVITTLAGRYTYRVTGTQIVSPQDSHVIATTDDTVATLTLTSCHPAYTADQRIVVSATLDAAASDRPGPAVRNYGRGQAPPDDTLPGDESRRAEPQSPTATTVTGGGDDPTIAPPAPAGGSGGAAPNDAAGMSNGADGADVTDDTAEAFDQGWFDDDGAFVHVGLWGTALTAVALGAHALSRRARRDWVGALAGIVPFAVCLYFFFQNVNRLLPAAL